jgi:hypothetical protein
MAIKKYSTKSLPSADQPANPGEDTWVVSDGNGNSQSFNNRAAAQVFEKNLAKKQAPARPVDQASSQASGETDPYATDVKGESPSIPSEPAEKKGKTNKGKLKR